MELWVPFVLWDLFFLDRTRVPCNFRQRDYLPDVCRVFRPLIGESSTISGYLVGGMCERRKDFDGYAYRLYCILGGRRH